MAERFTSRRAALAAFVVLPLASPLTVAATGADGALVHLCAEIVTYWDWIDASALHPEWTDEILSNHCDRLNDMLETVIASLPSSAAGRAAKAKVLARELECFRSRETLDRTDRLVDSLLRDCLRDGGVA